MAGVVSGGEGYRVMAEQDIQAVIKRVMADVLDLSVNAINDDTSVETSPKWDSANHIQLVLALEEEFSISFDVSELESMISYFDIVNVVQSKL
jgi:acyl carrier protein